MLRIFTAYSYTKVNRTFFNWIKNLNFDIWKLQAAGTVFSKKLAIRIVFGAWCIVTLVLTEAYDSLFISYITAPIQQPLIKSIYELRTRPDVRLAVNKDFNMDMLFSVWITIALFYS